MVPLDHVYIYGKSSIQNNYKNEAQKANVWTFTRYNKYFNHSSDLNVTTISWTLCLVVQFPMRPYFSSSSFMFLWKILEILSIYHIGELAYECVCVNVWECAVHRSCVRRGKGRECGERTVLRWTPVCTPFQLWDAQMHRRLSESGAQNCKSVQARCVCQSLGFKLKPLLG